MVDTFRPVESELGEHELQHLEMIILLITHNINVGIEIILCKTALGSAQILGHIDGGAVRTQQELTVEAVGSQVAPNAAVRILHEHTHI